MRLSKIAVLVASAMAAQQASAALDISRVTEENAGGSSTACLIMSESMKADPKALEPAISVQNLATGKAQPVSLLVNERALCLSGLEFGTKYKVTLKQGLAAASGTKLAADKSVEFTTVDHQGNVSFASGNLISLASPEKKVAVESINLKKFRLNVFRLSTADPARDFSDIYSNESYHWSVMTSVRQYGTFLGSKDYSVDGVPNQKTVSLIDLKDFDDNLGAGIYTLILTDTDSDKCDASLSCVSTLGDNENALLLKKNIVISDLGVTTYQKDAGIDLAVRSLTSAAPVSGAKATLISASGDVLRTVTTDSNGYARFSREDIAGTYGRHPAVINVVKGGDFYSQDLRGMSLSIDMATADTPAMDLKNDFNVFAYTNRTLVRPGEKVRFSAIVRDGKLNAADVKALKVMVYRPDGVLYREATLSNPKTGAFEYEFKFDENAAFGSWQFKVGFDSKKILATSDVTVDAFVPSSIKAKLSASSDRVTAQDTLNVTTRFIYDAPAPEIAVSGYMNLRPAEHPVEKYQDYDFGSSDGEQFYMNVESGITDKTGVLRIPLDEMAQHELNRPYQIDLRLDVTDPNAKVLSYAKTFPVLFSGNLVGVKKDFSKENPYETDFGVILADQTGALHGGEVNYSIFRRHISYQYVMREGSWQFVRNEYKTPVTAGKIKVGPDTNARLRQVLQDGSYVAEFTSGNVTSTSYFYVGFADLEPNRPDRFQLFADREIYRPGDTATLEFDSFFDGYADLMLDGISGTPLSHHKISKGHNKIPVKIGPEFNRGAYAVLSLYSPAGGPLGAQRAIGVVYLDRDSSDRTLKITADLPKSVKPNSGVDLTLKVDGATDGTYVTAALVDEGILSINRQKSPAPDKAFFGRYAFSTYIYDAYGHIMRNADVKKQGYGGDDEDVNGAGPVLNSITRNLMSYYTPFIPVKDGKASLHFDLNDVSTTARLMVTAWSPDRVGSYSAQIPVKDVAVTRLNAPHYLHAGDIIQSGVSVNNLTGSSGDFTFTVSCRGSVKCERKGTISAANGEVASEPLNISTKGEGDGFVDIEVKGPGYAYKTTREVESVTRYSRMSESRIVLLNPGESKAVSFVNSFEDQSKVTARFGSIPLADTDAMLNEVLKDDASGVFDEISNGLLILDCLPALEKAGDRQRLQKATSLLGKYVAAVQNRYSYGYMNTSFSDSVSSDYALIYGTMFLYQADKAGFNVSHQLLQSMKNSTSDRRGNSNALISSMALYALAKMGTNVHTEAVYIFDKILNANVVAPMESMSYFAQIFGLYGDARRQQEALQYGVELIVDLQQKTQVNPANFTYSQIADKFSIYLQFFPAGVNTLTHDVLSLIRAAMYADQSQAMEKYYEFLNMDTYLSPASRYLLVNMAANFKSGGGSAEYSTKGGKVTVKNPSNSRMVATVSVAGNVTAKTAGDGYATVTQRYYDRRGNPMKAPFRIAVNDDVLVVNTVEFKTPYVGNITLEHKVPANTLFVSGLDKNEMKKQYPKLANDTFGYPTVTKGDTAFNISNYVNGKFFSYAYVLKGAYPGVSVPVMGTLKINKVQNRMFNFYDPAAVFNVK